MAFNLRNRSFLKCTGFYSPGNKIFTPAFNGLKES